MKLDMSLDFTRITEDEGELGKLFLRDFAIPVRSRFIRVGPDKVVLPEYYLRFSKAIADMEVRDDDVWVMSHPKTGTTWSQEMAWCISNDLDFEKAEENLIERFPYLEYSAMFDIDVVHSNYPGIELPLYENNSVQYISEIQSRRFIKTHLPWNLLPKQIQDGTKKPKIIYVSREPKDTCISYYHHCALLDGYRGSFDDFCKLFLGDTICFGPFWPHVMAFWKRRQQPNILFLKYEDMKQDLPAVIRQTAAFLENPLTPQQVSALAGHLSFESMKNNESVNYEGVVERARLVGVNNVDGHFMRKGVVGDWKGRMDQELVRKFDAWTALNLQTLESKL